MFAVAPFTFALLDLISPGFGLPATAPLRCLTYASAAFHAKFPGPPICPRNVPTISGHAVVSSIGQRYLRHLFRFCPVLFAFFAHILLSHRLLDLRSYFVLPAVPYLPPTTLSFSTCASAPGPTVTTLHGFPSLTEPRHSYFVFLFRSVSFLVLVP